MLSVGGLRHQFSLPENVQMSMFMTEFLRDVKEHLSVLGMFWFESLFDRRVGQHSCQPGHQSCLIGAVSVCIQLLHKGLRSQTEQRLGV